MDFSDEQKDIMRVRALKVINTMRVVAFNLKEINEPSSRQASAGLVYQLTEELKLIVKAIIEGSLTDIEVDALDRYMATSSEDNCDTCGRQICHAGCRYLQLTCTKPTNKAALNLIR